MKPELYPLGDYHSAFKEYPRNSIQAVNSNEFRCPLKGEWYLSGAIATAYKAPNDLSQEYWIATIVKVTIKKQYLLKEIAND